MKKNDEDCVKHVWRSELKVERNVSRMWRRIWHKEIDIEDMHDMKK